MEEMTGQIKFVTFFNSANGYTVLKVKNSDGKNLSVAGTDLPTQKETDFRFWGKYRESKYGLTFDAISAEMVVNKTRDSIRTYLGCGLFKGIGPKMAERIFDRFGEDTLDVLDNDPDRLTQVKGLSQQKVDEIKKTLLEKRYVQELNRLLSEFGVSPTTVYTLAKKLGVKAEEKIRANPYIMMRHSALSFVDCDRVAIGLRISRRSSVRVDALFAHTFTEFQMDGDTGAEIQTFGRKCREISTAASSSNALTIQEIEEEIISRVKESKSLHTVKVEADGKVCQYIFPEYLFAKEKETAEVLLKLSASAEMMIPDAEARIQAFENEKKIRFDALQKQAVLAALSAPVTVITGGAGTGKTTIMHAVAQILTDEDKDVLLLAPTGRAARKLEEYTGFPARTIHSYLGIYGSDDMPDDSISIENTTVIVDEVSMVGSVLAWSLITKLGKGSRLVLVGDPDQLPSVQPGAVLRDIIASGFFKTIRLDRVFRTDNGSVLYDNITKVNRGDTSLSSGRDCTFWKAESLAAAKEKIIELYKDRMSTYGVSNVMLLVPFRKNTCGVDDLNRSIQDIANPPSCDKAQVSVSDRIFREGDYVMHVVHNTEEASNGDLGFIKEIENDGHNYVIRVEMNGNLIEYTRDNINELTLAYAMTIHKSQGSEAKAVIVCITSDHRPMLYRNLPYVAFSRAREKLDVVCDTGLITAIRTVKANSRITLLPYFLRYFKGKYVLI